MEHLSLDSQFIGRMDHLQRQNPIGQERGVKTLDTSIQDISFDLTPQKSKNFNDEQYDAIKRSLKGYFDLLNVDNRAPLTKTLKHCLKGQIDSAIAAIKLSKPRENFPYSKYRDILKESQYRYMQQSLLSLIKALGVHECGTEVKENLINDGLNRILRNQHTLSSQMTSYNLLNIQGDFSHKPPMDEHVLSSQQNISHGVGAFVELLRQYEENPRAFTKDLRGRCCF